MVKLKNQYSYTKMINKANSGQTAGVMIFANPESKKPLAEIAISGEDVDFVNEIVEKVAGLFTLAGSYQAVCEPSNSRELK